ncbi:sulfur carrier protein [Actinopolymorpha cephalotaxi]|uniref:Sulfur carrier protein n=1 Tax=Actinopolymorpha cephalotaxi TaxID=504797 RepID=A0A1I2VNK7_9ACTN|nr:sulfur carrier protein ThiS [Actinopolymorpha cephalotaxi]NYH83279.1 sulfur carrier protein [Actinopolymorpha cephalotaxi]SFG89837.1 sulfur carrier protein [Actinopolymorpha cephalotaxi]
MDVTVNGELTQVPNGIDVADLVRRRLPDPRSVAVAVNGAVVRTGDWERTQLSSGDAVEIVTARQGG